LNNVITIAADRI